jgi:hypothetical protein
MREGWGLYLYPGPLVMLSGLLISENRVTPESLLPEKNSSRQLSFRPTGFSETGARKKGGALSRPALLALRALFNLSHWASRMDPFVLVSVYIVVVSQQGDKDHRH